MNLPDVSSQLFNGFEPQARAVEVSADSLELNTGKIVGLIRRIDTPKFADIIDN